MQMLLTVALVAATAGAAQAAPAGEVRVPSDACTLLTTEAIQSVQRASVTQQKASAHAETSVRFDQCFFATSDFVRSVSLTLISGTSPGDAGSVRQYWDATFHPRPKAPAKLAPNARPARKKNPPRAVEGAGDEAFWTGDERAGALYVLKGNSALRISVGGVSSEEERIERSKTLAAVALQRLR